MKINYLFMLWQAMSYEHVKTHDVSYRMNAIVLCEYKWKAFSGAMHISPEWTFNVRVINEVLT